MKVLNHSLNQHPDFDNWKQVCTIEVTNSVVVFDEMSENKQKTLLLSSLAVDNKRMMCIVH